jgi:hypothetical protein
MAQVLSPAHWARQQFGQAQLGDKRITDRVVTYAAAAAKAPSQSIPQQCGGSWNLTKGAYRLFDNPQVHFDKLQQPHRRQTMAAATQCGVALFVHDTTALSFNHPATTDLGPTSTGGSGMLLHTTLAIDVSQGPEHPPFVLGLGHQQLWVRPEKPANGRPESSKWALGIEAVAAPPPGTRWVHVGDSESDCWEPLESCCSRGIGFALRACQNRRAIAGHVSPPQAATADESTLLFDLLGEQPALGNKTLWARGRRDRCARNAKLAVSATKITLLAPKNWLDKPHRKDQPRPAPLHCWAVRVYEINAPAGEDPIEWVILTDEPVTDLPTALKVAWWYSCRWLIEEYHKCLKTGCRMEDRQLETAGRLQSLLGVLAVVAFRLLQLKHQAKAHPDAQANRIIPQRYVKTLAAHLKVKPDRLTARQFWRETARLGGFLGRKGDGDPGWITLWRGWQHLELLADGMDLAEGRR